MRAAIPHPPVRRATAQPNLGLAPGLPTQVSKPILAGMRARAVADLCETLRVAAVLLDHDRRVLHVTSLAARELDTGAIGVVAGRLHATAEPIDRMLQALLADTVRDAPHNGRMHAAESLARGETGPSLTTVDYADPCEYQRLRCLLVFGDAMSLAAAMLADGGQVLHS